MQHKGSPEAGKWVRDNVGRQLIGLLVAGALFGCGGNGHSGGETTGTPDFSVNVQIPATLPEMGTSSASTAPSSVDFNVTVAPIDGFSGTVTLSSVNLDGVSSFSQVFRPVSVTLSGSSAQTVTFVVSRANATAPTGTFTFQITGTSGSTSHNASQQPQVKDVE